MEDKDKQPVRLTRFRSSSQPSNLDDLPQKESLNDSDKSQTTVNTITGGELDIPESSQKKTLMERLFGTSHAHEDYRPTGTMSERKSSLDPSLMRETSTSKSTFYVDSEADKFVAIETSGSDPIRDQTTAVPNMLEKKKKVQPVGTFEYAVTDTDTIEKIAARFDTTPSELKKLNKLVTSMIFVGQVIFVPDKDYVHVGPAIVKEPDKPTSPTKVESPVEKPTMDIPLVKAANGPPAKVPGHVERQISTSSTGSQQNGLDFEIVPHKLSEDEVEMLDKECLERFIKLNVKHITDGQGVVKGVLLVTPNAVMFDPDVMDPLVIEHGAEKYGMIAPMDLIISAAMYHDIAVMKMRERRHQDGAMYNKPVPDHDSKCPVLSHTDTDVQDTSKDLDLTKDSDLSKDMKAKLDNSLSVFSCGKSDEKHLEDSDRVEDLLSELSQGRLVEGEAMLEKEAKTEDDVSGNLVNAKEADSVFSEIGTKPTSKLKKGKKLSVSFSIPESDQSPVLDEAKHEPVNLLKDSEKVLEESGDIKEGSKGFCSVQNNENSLKQEDTSSAIDKDKNNEMYVDQVDSDKKMDKLESVSKKYQISDTESDTAGDCHGDKETRIGNIVYLPVTEDQNGEITEKSIKQTQNALSKLSAEEFTCDSNTDKSLAQNSSTKNEEKSEDKTDSSVTSALGPFSPTPHINAFVNYATGFFQKHAQDLKDVKDIKEMPSSKPTEESVKSFDIPVVGVSHGERKRVGKLSRHENLADIEVESAVRLDEKSDLFTLDYKRFARQATHHHDPPLYLCLRLGTPQKAVFHNYSIESYGKRRKKSEYWFSIPREKVDHLYAFFVQWTPEIYGDEDELTAERRGFVVIEDEDEDGDGSLDMLDEHFGPNSEFQKDWEIISKFEAERRRSIVYHEPLPLPDLIGESMILDDEKISKLCQMLPGRTVGYPWTLIYSTETHGFSLKTLFREMHDLESPILLVVKDISDNVFGALTSCELKVSDSFYGTGETFLYTFYPEFKVFNWTGENNFFMKGNNESLSVGAGQGLFGLWFDGDIYHGRTNRCETFDNDILTVSEDFIVKAFEAWAFIWD